MHGGSFRCWSCKADIFIRTVFYKVLLAFTKKKSSYTVAVWCSISALSHSRQASATFARLTFSLEKKNRGKKMRNLFMTCWQVVFQKPFRGQFSPLNKSLFIAPMEMAYRHEFIV